MRYFLKMNGTITCAMLVLTVLGIIFIRSAGASRTVAALRTAWHTQAWVAVVGVALYFVCARLDYRKVLHVGARTFYYGALLLLVVVLVMGESVYGGKRWLWFFQPSEVAKLAVIMFLAEFLGTKDCDDAKVGFGTFWRAVLMCGVPAILILLEPDLGTALVLVPTALVMMVAARVWLSGLIPLLLAGFLLGGALLGTVYVAQSRLSPSERAQVYRVMPLREHQINRLRVFLFPESDPYGGGWNLRQAKLSIGSGAVWGKGLGKGDQKFLGYLPKSVSMNDFIFAVLAEETGFVGGSVMLLLYLALLIGGVFVAFRATDDRGRLLVIGILTLLFAHVYVNVAMALGLVPITGLPLPFISAGKTFLIVLMIGLGLVQSVAIHRKEIKE